jgi:hypothetical protein
MMWKISLVEKLGFRWGKQEGQIEVKRPHTKNKKSFYNNCEVTFGANRLFTEARKKAYQNGKKEYTKDWVNVDVIDDLALAIWWMDDGSKSVSKQSQSVAGQLHVCATKEELEVVKEFLEYRLDAEVAIHRRRELFHIYLPHYAYVKMLKRIWRYIHPELLYKCPVIMGEDNKPIIPNSAEQLRGHIESLKLKI